ncbi:MAG: DEAD/DEAH box helicase [Nitriliruptoraceae bacterium]
MTKSFRELGVAAELCDELETQGITHPFPIQEQTLPLALAGHDLIGQARTGTGKTLAFGLPLLQRIDTTKARTQALVVVPTRELCLQVFNDLSIGKALGVSAISVYGGVGYDTQTDALNAGAHVVVGTPGRLLDLLNRGVLRLHEVATLVLDEADEMLDMGFLPDVEQLIEACQPEGRHTMLFSATMPAAIVKLGRRYMDNPTFTRADSSQDSDTAPTVEQHFLQVHRMDKPRVLARILQAKDRKAVFVFVRTKHMADRLVDELEALNTPAIAIHGDLRQQTREHNLDRFRSGKASVLVATEVAARGLDITDVTHVINYDCPDDDKMYLHRIGRTARAGQAGCAVTFAEFNEASRLDVIRKAIGQADNEIIDVFSTSPELTKRFDLPEATPWEHLSRRTKQTESSSQSKRETGRRRSSSTRSDRAPSTNAPSTTANPPATTPPAAVEQPSAKAAAETSSPTGRSDDSAGDGVRVRTRTRSRTREAAGSGSASGQRSEQRATTEKSRVRATSKRRDNNRGTSTREANDGDAGKRSDESERRKPGAEPGNGGGRNQRGKSAGKRQPSGNGANRDDRQQQPRRTAPETAKRGADARGDGRPQSSRRVKVEHLP